jgi:precorrin-6B C5,15-methyltransferase / cobalt-precorrin-6B C5,C15-methyltransferase
MSADGTPSGETLVEQRIDVIGIGVNGPASLRADLVERIRRADFLAGGERHLSLFPEGSAKRFVIKDNVSALLEELARRHPGQRCVVLASGDPLFYGIGVQLAARFGKAVRFEPALSSMQLAFARAGVPWQDAKLASVHGRALRPTLLPLLGQPLIGLFTQDGETPAAVARFFLDYGLDDYEAVVGESLGAADERVTRWPNLHSLAEQAFRPLNYLIFQRNRAGQTAWADAMRHRALVPGVPDDAFNRPAEGPEVMTRQEVRSVVVGKLLGELNPGDVIWDVGAGLGTVAVECAVLRPHVEVVAVERDPARLELLRQNRLRFGAYNICVVAGTAPEALVTMERAAEVTPAVVRTAGVNPAARQTPQRIFVGGSGGKLAEILDLAGDRLVPGGRLVAAFVTLEHLALALEKLRQWQWPSEVTEINVSRSDTLAGLTGLKPQRGVFLVSADKPGSGRE